MTVCGRLNKVQARTSTPFSQIFLLTFDCLLLMVPRPAHQLAPQHSFAVRFTFDDSKYLGVINQVRKHQRCSDAFWSDEVVGVARLERTTANTEFRVLFKLPVRLWFGQSSLSNGGGSSQQCKNFPSSFATSNDYVTNEFWRLRKGRHMNAIASFCVGFLGSSRISGECKLSQTRSCRAPFASIGVEMCLAGHRSDAI